MKLTLIFIFLFATPTRHLSLQAMTTLRFIRVAWPLTNT